MNKKYKRWYTQLMKRAAKRDIKEYCERHHVVPRSLGGTNDPVNLVRLTYREHFLAHWLLIKFTTGRNRKLMEYALNRMTHRYNQPVIIAGWQYALARKINPGLRTYKMTPAHRRKLTASVKGRPLTPEHRAKLSAANKGYQASAETRAKLRASHKGRYPEFRFKKGNQVWLGRKHKPETLKKIGAATARYWQARREESRT